MSAVAQLHQGNYSFYTAGMGDVTTGIGNNARFSFVCLCQSFTLSAALLYGIAAALRERQRTGYGQLVYTSLLKVGTYIMSPIHATLPRPAHKAVRERARAQISARLLTSVDSRHSQTSAPDYSKSDWTHVAALDGSYRTSDGVLVQLCAAREHKSDSNKKWFGETVDYESGAAVRRAVAHMTYAQLRDTQITHSQVMSIEDIACKDEPHPHFRTCNWYYPW